MRLRKYAQRKNARRKKARRKNARRKYARRKNADEKMSDEKMSYENLSGYAFGEVRVGRRVLVNDYFGLNAVVSGRNQFIWL